MSRTRNNIKLGLAMAMVVILVTLVLFFYQLKRHQKQPVIPLPKTAANAILTLTSGHHRATNTEDGTVQWELDFESAQLEEGSQLLRLQSPKVVFYMEDGDRIEMTAAQGILNTKNNDLVVDGAVHLFNKEYTMTTEKLTYRHEQRVLKSEGAVHITGEVLQLQAKTMTYDIATNQAHFVGQVEGHILGGADI